MRPFRSAVLLCAATLAAAVWPAGASAAARYQVTILPPLPGGSESIARDLNDAGVAVGNATAEGDEPGFASRAVRWVDGAPEELLADDDASLALAVNDLGQIAGQGSDGAFLWDDGDVTPLGTLNGGFAQPNGINDAAWIVGTASVGTAGDFHAFLWRDGEMVDLGTLGGPFSLAQDINEDGLIAGGALARGAGTGSPVVWDANLAIHDLPTLGGPGGLAFAVNDAGQVAGQADTEDGLFHAALWQADGSVTDLHGFGTDSLAEDLNDAGQVVGGVVLEDGSPAGFLWEDGTMHDLNDLIPADSDLSISTASAVNEQGQIAGFGTVAGEARGYVLTPVPDGGDVTPPAVDAPDRIVRPANQPRGRVVDVEARITVTDDQDPAPTLACEPPSGSRFPIGATTVTCTATDAAGNATTVTIDVVVRSATKQLRNLKAVVRHLALADADEARLLEPLNQALFLRRTEGRAAACPALDRFAARVTGAEAVVVGAAVEARLAHAAQRIGRVLGCG